MAAGGEFTYSMAPYSVWVLVDVVANQIMLKFSTSYSASMLLNTMSHPCDTKSPMHPQPHTLIQTSVCLHSALQVIHMSLLAIAIYIAHTKSEQDIVQKSP